MISIDWGTRIIHIPQSFLTPMGGASYRLDTNELRIALRDLEDDAAGAVFPPTHNHNTKVLLGGIEYARVIEIINGYTITFEDVGVPYRVFLTGSNNNILDVTNLNNVSVAPNNSAGLVQMSEIEQGVFNQGVTIDVVRGVPGTLYPTGTPLRPVNNIADANLIAAARGFKTFYILGDITLGAGDDVCFKKLIGENASRSMIVIEPEADTTGVEILEAAITGTLDGSTIIRNCYVFDLEYVAGFLFQCQIAGYLRLGGVMPASLMSCYAGSQGAVIDMNGSGHALSMAAWTGDVRIANKTGPDICNLHVMAASIVLDATVTNGAGIHIAGLGEYVNESSITPERVGMTSPETVAAEVVSVAQANPISVDVKRMNGAVLHGTGTESDMWRGNVQQ